MPPCTSTNHVYVVPLWVGNCLICSNRRYPTSAEMHGLHEHQATISQQELKSVQREQERGSKAAFHRSRRTAAVLCVCSQTDVDEVTILLPLSRRLTTLDHISTACTRQQKGRESTHTTSGNFQKRYVRGVDCESQSSREKREECSENSKRLHSIKDE